MQINKIITLPTKSILFVLSIAVFALSYLCFVSRPLFKLYRANKCSFKGIT